MPDVIEYNDETLRIVIPDDLKQKRTDTFWSFCRQKRRWLLPGIATITVEILDEYTVNVVAGLFDTAHVRTESEWAGIKQSLVRLVTRTQDPRDGCESLSTEINSVTGQIFHFYNTLMIVAGQHIYASFGGCGPIEDFDETCKAIVSSIKLPGLSIKGKHE